MKKSEFDLDLPDWGPYGKEYVGLSHIADAEKGDRWDCFVMSGPHRRAAICPYGQRENHWHFWKTAPDLSSYTLRYELEWKDRVYIEATFEGQGEGRFIHVDCVNNTDLPQNLDVHLVATLSRNPLNPSSVRVPDRGYWIGAADYKDIRQSGSPFRKNQTADALRPGLWEQPGSVNASTVGATNFFKTVGDRLDYQLDLADEIEDAVLVIRYHRWADTLCRVQLEAFGQVEQLDLICDGTPMTQLEIPVGKLSGGVQEWSFELMEGSGLVLEGFALLPRSDLSNFEVVPGLSDSRANIVEDGAVWQLSYPECEHTYKIVCPEEVPVRLRRIQGEDVGAIQGRHANDDVHSTWSGIGNRESLLLTCGPIALKSGESKNLSFRVGLASAELKHASEFAGNVDSTQPYAFGVERLAATAFANVVFPIRHRDGYVRHNAPGRWWNCLYTWDSGMVGLGLAALDIERAKGCLGQYLLPEDDVYAGFVEHGTPLPIQAELAREIWDQTKDEAWLAEVYPKLRNFYEWLAGRTRASTTDRFKSGLLQTWDYFYNSGGWDDYPAQWELKYAPERRRDITPCVTTSFAIRFAKHMSVFAQELGEFVDLQRYAEDLLRWTAALEHAWDAEAGYYSYVEHDEEGNPTGFFRHESGENYNRGFDGIIPLVTGVLPEARRAALLEKLFDSEEIWTEWGGTTVSQSASYYSDAGYWNGAIWMPHNYMLWKALREQGMFEEARKLADAVLGCWERETQASYHCFELFRADTGRGSGWHQFSALSAPLLAVYRGEFLDRESPESPIENTPKELVL